MTRQKASFALVAVALLVLAGSLPPAAGAQDMPNVLIIVTDDQRADALGTMPKIQEWFAEQGAHFANAYATTPLCCPSRASIFTGGYTHNHHVDANAGHAVRNLDPRTTLTYYLKSAGYTTGIFGKYFNPWPLDRRPHYFDRWATTNYRYYGARFNVQGEERIIKRYSTHFVADKAANFLNDAAPSDEPWFLYVAPVAPHSPHTPEKDYRDATVPAWEANPAVTETDRSDKPRWLRALQVSVPEARRLRRRQLRTLLTVNDMVGRLMRRLSELGEAENTIAIFTSDNGFFWGEHHLYDKRLPYLQSIEIPLYVRWTRGLRIGQVDERLAANIDIAPTVLDAVGIDPTHTVDGRSLLDNWDRERLLLEYERDDPPYDAIPPWASVFTRGYQYTEYYRDNGDIRAREYFDLLEDPWQLTNQLGDSDASNDPSSDALNALSEQLATDRSCAGSSCP